MEKYRALGPDLTTMDIVMPEKNGIEALKLIMAGGIYIPPEVLRRDRNGRPGVATQPVIAPFIPALTDAPDRGADARRGRTSRDHRPTHRMACAFG